MSWTNHESLTTLFLSLPMTVVSSLRCRKLCDLTVFLSHYIYIRTVSSALLNWYKLVYRLFCQSNKLDFCPNQRRKNQTCTKATEDLRFYCLIYIYCVFVQDLQWHNHLTIWHFSANHFADFCFAQ